MPSAGQWWLCINYLQTQAQGNQALTRLTGLLKGNAGSPVTAAIAGTDYAPATSGAGVLKGDGSGGTAAALAGTDYETPANVAAAISAALPSATTSSIGGSVLAAGACSSSTVTVTGATTGMVANVSPTTYPGDAIYWKAYVSGTNTVTVKVCASIAATPIASTYNVGLQP